MADAMMRFSAKQLAVMTENIKQRERARIAEELQGFAAFEQSVGHTEAAVVLRTIAEGMTGVPEAKKVPLTPEQIAEAAQRLVIPGMERLPFPGYDSAMDDGLAPLREHGDGADIAALVHRIGA